MTLWNLNATTISDELTGNKELIYPQWIKVIESPSFFMESNDYKAIAPSRSGGRNFDFGMFEKRDNQPDIIIPLNSAPKELNIYSTVKGLTGQEKAKFLALYPKLDKYLPFRGRGRIIKKGYLSGANDKKHPALFDMTVEGKLWSVMNYEGTIYIIEPLSGSKKGRKLSGTESEAAHLLYKV